MIEHLLDSLNAMLSHHPHLLHLMRLLFWAKSWILFGIFARFVYLVWKEQDVGKKAGQGPAKAQPASVFIA
jgi:hypothetical protein